MPVPKCPINVFTRTPSLATLADCRPPPTAYGLWPQQKPMTISKNCHPERSGRRFRPRRKVICFLQPHPGESDSALLDLPQGHRSGTGISIRMNTCGSLSKQSNLNSFRMTTFAKTGGYPCDQKIQTAECEESQSLVLPIDFCYSALRYRAVSRNQGTAPEAV
jgi:hypothetical protein